MVIFLPKIVFCKSLCFFLQSSLTLVFLLRYSTSLVDVSNFSLPTGTSIFYELVFVLFCLFYYFSFQEVLSGRGAGERGGR